MLGTDRTTQLVDEVMHDPIELWLTSNEIIARHFLGRQKVVVKIAVADVTKPRAPSAGKQVFDGRVRFLDELHQRLDRQRHVVLHMSALESLSFGH